MHNENVIADGRWLPPGTDADGFADHLEKTLGTCASDEAELFAVSPDATVIHGAVNDLLRDFLGA